MIGDPRARRVWQLYFLRAEAALGSLSPPIRRELLDDLKAHARDILGNANLEGDEFARVTAALARLGEPKEFLAPLIADAVFRAPLHSSSVRMTMDILALYATRGVEYLFTVVGLALVAVSGVVLALASFNSLMRPQHAGIFRLPNDEIQVVLFGLSASGGEQLLSPWTAVPIAVLGLAFIAWALWRAHKMFIELIVNATV